MQNVFVNTSDDVFVDTAQNSWREEQYPVQLFHSTEDNRFVDTDDNVWASVYVDETPPNGFVSTENNIFRDTIDDLWFVAVEPDAEGLVCGIQPIISSFGEFWVQPVNVAINDTVLQRLRYDLSPGAWAVQQIVTKLCSGNPTGQAEIILNKLAQEVAGHEEIIYKLSLGIQQIQALKQTISSAEIKSTQNVLIDILEKDTASGTQIMLQSMEDQQAHFHV